MIRLLNLSDYEAYASLRTLGLETNPASFWASENEEAPIRNKRFSDTIEHAENFMLGVFEGVQLVSVLGFLREGKVKLKHKGYFWGVYTHPDFRGNGYGMELMKMAIQMAFELDDLTQINLSVGSKNTAAKGLYLKMGFEIWGEEKNAAKVDGKFNDELYLVKTKG